MRVCVCASVCVCVSMSVGQVAPAMGMNFLTYEFVKARFSGVPLGLRWREGS